MASTFQNTITFWNSPTIRQDSIVWMECNFEIFQDSLSCGDAKNKKILRKLFLKFIENTLIYLEMNPWHYKNPYEADLKLLAFQHQMSDSSEAHTIGKLIKWCFGNTVSFLTQVSQDSNSGPFYRKLFQDSNELLNRWIVVINRVSDVKKNNLWTSMLRR